MSEQLPAGRWVAAEDVHPSTNINNTWLRYEDGVEAKFQYFGQRYLRVTHYYFPDAPTHEPTP